MNQFRFWQTGSISGAAWSDIRLLLPYFLTGFILCIFLASSLNTLALGDEAATGLGLNVPLIRAVSTVASVLLCASTTALAGPISFIGLMIPHLVSFSLVLTCAGLFLYLQSADPVSFLLQMFLAGFSAVPVNWNQELSLL